MAQNRFRSRLCVNRYRGSWSYLKDLPKLTIIGIRNLIFCDLEKDTARIKDNLIQNHNIDHESEIIFEGLIDLQTRQIIIYEEYNILEASEIFCNALRENSNNRSKELLDLYNLSLYYGDKFFATMRDLSLKKTVEPLNQVDS